jgi:hypothetical protein
MVLVPTDPPIMSQQMSTGLEICIENVQNICGNSTKNMTHSVCFIIWFGRYLITIVFRNFKKFLYSIALFSKICFLMPYSLRAKSQFKLRKTSVFA